MLSGLHSMYFLWFGITHNTHTHTYTHYTFVMAAQQVGASLCVPVVLEDPV